MLINGIIAVATIAVAAFFMRRSYSKGYRRGYEAHRITSEEMDKERIRHIRILLQKPNSYEAHALRSQYEFTHGLENTVMAGSRKQTQEHSDEYSRTLQRTRP